MINRKATRKVMAACPECEDNIIMTGKSECGRRVVCPHCGVDLEVINTDPVELDWVYEVSDFAGYEDEEEDDW